MEFIMTFPNMYAACSDGWELLKKYLFGLERWLSG